MKKRAPESDVGAMAAANAERQATAALQNPDGQLSQGSGVVASLSIVDSNKIPYTGSLDNGPKLFASITITSGEPGDLYIAGVELVDRAVPSELPQQLLQLSADCLNNAVVLDTCTMGFSNLLQYSIDNHKPVPRELVFTNTKLTAGHKYSFNLRYSDKSKLAKDILPSATAENGAGEVLFLTAYADSKSSTDPDAASTTSTSTSTSSRVANASLATGGIAKPTESPDSTVTPTSTPASAFPSGLSSGLAPPSAPSNKGLSTGAKAGIGVGVAAVVLIVIALLVAWWVRRTRRGSTRGGAGEKESVLAAAAPGGAGEYRDADEAGGAVVGVVVGGSPVTRKPVGAPVTNEAALADAVSPASTTVGVVGGAQRRGAGGEGAAQESMLNAEERERWEEEERRLDEDIAEAERRRLGA
ncbi:hypothetical protein VF21_05760 [Pseudogymnoascus sp. 05NY08]|nr:hypothetical protein VF21_05760 [Pseudogymnoascus sp. 05NY08]